MKVLKFGGTSVGSAQRMRALPALIADGSPKIVVLSAMQGATNTLANIASLCRQGSPAAAQALARTMSGEYDAVIDQLFDTQRYKDEARKGTAAIFEQICALAETQPFALLHERIALAQGELLSTLLLNLYLNEIGAASVLLPALNFMRKDITDEPDIYFIREILKREMAQYPHCPLFITQGYICRNHRGEVDNLRRGGSDYTASLIGAAIHAQEVQIWTDIDGFHNNDPRVVSHTRPIARLSFDEAAELAYFGAKILHPSCVLPVHEAGIPLIIKNTMNPSAAGTRISAQADGERIIKAVAAKDGVTAINIKSARMLMAYGFLRKIFEVFERYHTAIDMVSTSEVAVSLTIDDDVHLPKIVEELKDFGIVEASGDMTIICVVGSRIAESAGVAGRIFSALSGVPVRMISFGGSSHNVSFLVSSPCKKTALEALNLLMREG